MRSVCRNPISAVPTDMGANVMIYRLLGTRMLIRAKMSLSRQSLVPLLCPLRITFDLL